jgi:regulatory protein
MVVEGAGSPERTPRSGRNRVRQDALRLLARAPRSREELRRSLVRRHAASDVEAVLGELGERGAVDDRTTAREWLAYRTEARPAGRVRWQADLLRRGFPRAVVEEALDAYYRDRREVDDLERALAGALRGRALPEDPAERRRLAARLARRGFAAETIWEALRGDAGPGG